MDDGDRRSDGLGESGSPQGTDVPEDVANGQVTRGAPTAKKPREVRPTSWVTETLLAFATVMLGMGVIALVNSSLQPLPIFPETNDPAGASANSLLRIERAITITSCFLVSGVFLTARYVRQVAMILADQRDQ